MTQPQFTLDWPYGWQTRDGRDVVIYCTDAPGNSPIHGRINGVSAAITWNIHGRFRVDRFSELDLINRPAPVVCVPMDKLHDAVRYSETIWRDRPIKWFFADEVEASK